MSQITHDLAIVARVSRAGLPTIDATLADVLGPPVPANALELSRIYVARAARVAAGATAGIATIFLFAWARTQHGDFANNVLPAQLEEMVQTNLWVPMVSILFAAAIAYAVAVHRAARHFARRPDARPRLEVLSQLVPVAGAMTFLSFFGIVHYALGDTPLAVLRGLRVAGFDGKEWSHEISDLAICALAAGLLATLAVRRVSRPVALGGVLLIFATIAVGNLFDVGPIDPWRNQFHPPSMPLRIALTAFGTAGLFLAVRGYFTARIASEVTSSDQKW